MFKVHSDLIELKNNQKITLEQTDGIVFDYDFDEENELYTILCYQETKDKDSVFVNILDINVNNRDFENLYNSEYMENKDKCIVKLYCQKRRFKKKNIKKNISADRTMNIKTFVKENKLEMKKKLVFFIEE
jgi:hypothetical protein